MIKYLTKPPFTRIHYVVEYTSKLEWAESYMLLDYIYSGKWNTGEQSTWAFAADYIGKTRATGGLGRGLLYNDRDNLKLVSLLDNHKWGIT